MRAVNLARGAAVRAKSPDTTLRGLLRLAQKGPTREAALLNIRQRILTGEVTLSQMVLSDSDRKIFAQVLESLSLPVTFVVETWHINTRLAELAKSRILPEILAALCQNTNLVYNFEIRDRSTRARVILPSVRIAEIAANNPDTPPADADRAFAKGVKKWRIDTKALSNPEYRLGPTHRGRGDPRASRFADERFCEDNSGEPGFNSISHFQRIADARAGKPVPTAILRLLEAGIITRESDYVALDRGRYVLPPLEETWALPERTVPIDQDTALVKLTKGFAEQFRILGNRGLLTRADNLHLRPDQFLVASMIEIEMRLLDLNDALSPAGVELSLPAEPIVELALGKLNPVPDGLNLACFSSSVRYGEPACRGPITDPYVSRHKVDALGRTRSLYRKDEPANFLLQIKLRQRESA